AGPRNRRGRRHGGGLRTGLSRRYDLKAVESAFGRGGGPKRVRNRQLGLYQLLDPEVLADPYPLYHRLRSEDPVCWDPFLHTWVVTRYEAVLTVLQSFSAKCTPTPEHV